jgi:hypothetical protein
VREGLHTFAVALLTAVKSAPCHIAFTKADAPPTLAEFKTKPVTLNEAKP